MTNVILQPASGVESRGHYRLTVENLVSLSRIRDYLANDAYESLSTAIGTGNTCVWGIRPSMVSQWNKIQVGDKVLFAKDKRFFGLSTVTWKTNSGSLATHLWGPHVSGDTWEFIYFFGPPEDIDIPYASINAVVPDRKPGAVPQGVSVLTSAKADAVIELLSGATLVKEREPVEGPDGSIVMRDSYMRTEPERALVKSFEELLKKKEFKPYSRVIPANGSVFRNDIFLDEVNFLIEAKIYTRENVRMVIGQIKDYARYCEPYPYCAALLSEKPDSELIDLLLKQDIYCIWKDSSNDSFDHNIPDGMLFS